ncbi:hypothetical protein D9M73_130510 [compost metagenome]
MYQPLGRVVLAHALEQFGGQPSFIRPQCRGIPLGAVRVINGHEGRLAAHGQAYIAFQQIGIDLPAQGLNRLPLVVGVGLGDPWCFPNPLHGHFVAEFALAGFHQATDRCRRRRIGTTGQRNMSFTGKQPGGCVQADPAGTGQVHLAPGVQVGEVHFGTGRTVEAFQVGGQLNQVTRHETRGQSQVTQQLYQQPRRIATGTGGLLQGVFGRLHPRFHPDQVVDVFA